MSPSDSLDSAMGGGLQMTHGTSLSDVLSGIHLGVGIVLFQLAIYLFYSYCQYTLSKKLNVEYSWMAWVPFLSSFNLVKIAGLSYWWVLWLIIGFICLFVPGLILSIIVLHKISTRTGHGGFWTVGLLFLYFIMFPVTALTYTPQSSEVPATPTV